MRVGRLFLGVLVAGAFTTTVVACVGDEPGTTPNPNEPDGTTADGATSGNVDSSSSNPDGSTPTDSGSDAVVVGDAGNDANAAPPDFCQSAAALGAAFCVDFQTGADVAAGWSSTTIAGGATVGRNEAFGFNSTRSATVTLGGTNTAQGTLTKVVSAGGLKSVVKIEYDAYFVFPSWPANSYNGFITGITRTSSVGLGSQHYFDLERQPSDWKVTAGNGTPVAALSTAPTPNAWHHIDMTYDATGGQAALRLTVDGTLVSSLSLPKGTPPNAAPATFDEVIINAGSENLGAPLTMTQFTFDNLVVRFP